MTSPAFPLWLRAETKENEQRAIIPPAVAKTLIEKGFEITVERSEQRVFADEEYER